MIHDLHAERLADPKFVLVTLLFLPLSRLLSVQNDCAFAHVSETCAKVQWYVIASTELYDEALLWTRDHGSFQLDLSVIREALQGHGERYRLNRDDANGSNGICFSNYLASYALFHRLTGFSMTCIEARRRQAAFDLFGFYHMHCRPREMGLNR